jgi:ABC-type transport system involved in cytochrome c biogenesis permease subunit
MILFVAAFLLVLAYWVKPLEWDWTRKSAAGLVLLALVVHTTGLIYRMALEGRPPVTNLYSSAIFIGWGATILGLVLERFWRNSIGLVVSASIGFITLIIAHHLSLGGDTMEMMRAVLDTNFWLATHVVVVTLGYASTFVAGFLAIVFILRGVFTSALTEAMRKSLARMTYGIICFAALFSFVGTVLGGIWADQSWGRFWGWDAKENGALIIVLWNALILHARWGGMIRERGLAVMAIVGNIVTGWSWFGVNMLGIGLHSYGFTDQAFRWLLLFAVSQLALIGLGLLPMHMWRSFKLASPSQPSSEGEKKVAQPGLAARSAPKPAGAG